MPINPMQMLQMLQQNPAQMLRQRGLNVPANLNDPNAIIQHLMNSGQITQALGLDNPASALRRWRLGLRRFRRSGRYGARL